MLQNFRTFQISVTFFQSCQKIKLPNYLKDQLDRASSSISLNLAEGYGKRTYKDQRKFFSIALGSLRESQAILTLADLTSTDAFEQADYLGASLYKLIKSKGS
ncbi:MAG: four helix bundle protein [Bacteriovoracaceae bacterium]|nr:four helix bundle protein [Bacteriovoracaceae bacterium]